MHNCKAKVVVVLAFAGAVTLVLTSCTKFKYEGVEYPKTSEVIVLEYEQIRDIDPADYEIMGKIEASGKGMVSGGNLEGKLIKEGRKRGADAVVMEFFGERKEDAEQNPFSRHPNEFHNPRVTSKRLTAYLIKFKRAVTIPPRPERPEVAPADTVSREPEGSIRF